MNYLDHAVRLVNGANSSHGRVEIIHEGEWGTVCDDGFDEREALVVCKAFGYVHGKVRKEAYYGQGEGKIWMDDLECTGEEVKLADCNFHGWGRSDCGHGEDVGVDCSE